MQPIHFISDLHLSAQTPGVARIFHDYLAGPAAGAEQLYILGDLFEVWPGDDCLAASDQDFNREIVAALHQLSSGGVELAIMHGNRDFLLGTDFARACGARLIGDPHVLALAGKSFVLSHGDLLCTDDSQYQAFRVQVRDPAWRTAFLAKPLDERQAMANALREQSEKAKRDKLAQAQQYQMDVNATAVEQLMRQHAHATLIHGHTHHPATHTHWIDTVPVERHVTADWTETSGEYLEWNGQRLLRQALA